MKNPLLRYAKAESSAVSSLLNEVKSVFYQDSQKGLTWLSVNKDTFHAIDRLLVVESDGTTHLHDLQTQGGDKFAASLGIPVLALDAVPAVYDSATASLGDYIKGLSYDDLLKRYLGKRNYTEVFGDAGADTSNVTLRGLETGDKHIDAVQLEGVFDEIKSAPYDYAAKMLHAFPEWTITSNTSPIDEIKIIKEISSLSRDIIYAYLYFKRWYHYEIGGLPASDVFYGRQSLFSKDKQISDLQHLKSTFEIFNKTPWGPDYVYTMSFFQADVLYKGADSLNQSGKGFDHPDLKDAGKVLSMGSIIEFLIRTLEGHSDYQRWFDGLGFVTATSAFPDSIPLESKTLWQALRSAEKSVESLVNPGIITVILSVVHKADIIIANSPAELILGNTKKLRSSETRTPQALAQLYADDSVRGLSFLWNTGHENVRKQLTSWVSAAAAFTFDTGELLPGNKKKFDDPDNTFCYELMRAASLNGSVFLTDTALNGIAAPMKSGKSAVFLAQNALGSEYTISHEVMHRYTSAFVRLGKGERYSLEQLASLFQNDTNTLHINYYYHSTTTNWNRVPPASHDELVSYTRQYLDLLALWNMEKARTVFALPADQQLKHVFIGEFSVGTQVASPESGEQAQLTDPAVAALAMAATTRLVARRVTAQELAGMNISPDSPSFLKQLFDNRIILPADTSKDSFTVTDLDNYAAVPFNRDAYFNVPYTGGDWAAKVSTNTVNGFTYYWSFAAIAAKGWEGLYAFYTSAYGTRDADVLKTALALSTTPEEYLMAKITDAQAMLDSKGLRFYSAAELKKAVQDNLDNDSTAKAQFIAMFIEKSNNLYDSIYNT